MHGRVDDVVNVSGHRLSTVEIEQVVTSYQKISDAAAISIPDEITGEAIVLFIVLKNTSDKETIQQEIESYVSEKIGKLARPKLVCIISDLPKTRTGKVMRRLLRKQILGEELGDLTALENPHSLDEIRPV
jgi:acetyl-CoA synthetase